MQNKVGGSMAANVKTKKALLWCGITLVIIACVITIIYTLFIDKKVDKIKISYYYHSTCDSCQEDKKFYDLLNSEIGMYATLTDVDQEKPYDVAVYNTFAQANQERFEKMCQEMSIPKEKQQTPTVVINDSYLTGADEITAGLKLMYLEQASLAGIKVQKNPDIIGENSPLSTETTIGDTDNQAESGLTFDETDKPFSQVTPQKSHLVYFYTSSCADCQKVQETYQSLSPTYGNSQLSIDYKNILTTANLDLLYALFKEYKVPEQEQKVPIVFYEGGYLQGYEAINGQLVQDIERGKAQDFTGFEELITAETAKEKAGNVTVLSVILTGFVNGLNPCSISMILFLFSLLVAKNQNILKISIAYIVGKSISFVLIGIGIYFALGVMQSAVLSKVTTIIGIVLVIVCLVLFVMNLLDYISAKNEKYQNIKLQLPEFLRKANHNIIKKFTGNKGGAMLLIASFALGFILSIGEFLCTGQIYLATILSLFNSTQMSNLVAVMLFILYTLSMSIPFIIFAVIISKGKKVFLVSEKFRKLMPYVKLINAVIFLIFAGIAMIQLL